MSKKVNQLEAESENFELPFGGKLAEDHRWVMMRNQVKNQILIDRSPEKLKEDIVLVE